MSEIERIGDQIKRAFEAEAWHGPSVREVLEGITAEQAARKPIPEAHSIWELVLHMATWKDVVTRRMGGEKITEVPPEEDFPAVRATDERSWKQALERLEAAHQRLVAALAAIRDDQLDDPPPNGPTARYRLLHGIVQHDLYHAGQIAVLRKG
jgi:uncharacterized damage-inducible protein DinB